MSQTCEKFATQVNAELLATLRAIAGKEGRQIQVRVHEALADLIEKRKQACPARTSWRPTLAVTTSTASSKRNSQND
jgi:hypothetical protein